METVVEAICGGIAATFVLPARTRDVVRAEARDALEGARSAIDGAVARLTEQGAIEPQPALIGRGHELRRCIVSLNAPSS